MKPANQSAYWQQVPDAVKLTLHYYNVPCSVEPDSEFNPLRIVRTLYQPGDFVVIKVLMQQWPEASQARPQSGRNHMHERCSAVARTYRSAMPAHTIVVGSQPAVVMHVCGPSQAPAAARQAPLHVAYDCRPHFDPGFHLTLTSSLPAMLRSWTLTMGRWSRRSWRRLRMIRSCSP